MSDKHPTRFDQFNYFIEEVARHLPHPAFAVWLVIFRHADKFGRAPKVTRSRIAACLGVSLVTVSNGIRALKECGMIEKRDGGNGYNIGLPTLQQLRNLYSKEIFTVKKSLHPPLRNLYTPRKDNFTPPLRNLYTLQTSSEQCTEHTDLRSTPSGGPRSKSPAPKPKQQTLKGTGKRETWQEQAKRMGFWDFQSAYPNVADKAAAKRNFALWKEAMKEADVPELEPAAALDWLRKIKTTRQWLEKQGRFVPTMKRCIEERRWRIPIDGNTVDDYEGIDF